MDPYHSNMIVPPYLAKAQEKPNQFFFFNLVPLQQAPTTSAQVITYPGYEPPKLPSLSKNSHHLLR